MAQLTLSDAARQVGVSRQTIYKYVAQGRLSATIAHNGQKQVEVTELLRVFGRLQSPADDRVDSADDGRHTAATPLTGALQLELERAKMQIQARDTELALMRERLEELKQRELEAKAQAREAIDQQNRLLGIVEAQNRLLVAPQQPPMPTPPVSPPEAVSAAAAPRTSKAKAATKKSASKKSAGKKSKA